MEFKLLYEELANSAEMIRAMLSGVTQAEARLKPDADSWSMLEVLCHLHDEEREDFREHLDFILHRQGAAWHAIHPSAWVQERAYNGRDFRAMKESFFAEREHSLEWLKGFASADWDTSYHSEYGDIRAGDMLASWIAHDNLHLRQLVELRRRRVENMAQPFAIAYAGDW